MIACVLVDGDAEVEVVRGTAAWLASLEWAKFHGLDPNFIPAGSIVERDSFARQIRYSQYVRDEAGDLLLVDLHPVIVDRVEQGEAPPLPFPAEVWA